GGRAALAGVAVLPTPPSFLKSGRSGPEPEVRITRVMAPRPAAPCGLLVLSVIAAAVGPADGDHLRGVALIDADVLKAWIDEGRQILVIDSRVTAEYREGHIPTAISVPAHTMDKHRHTFPGDHAYPLV